MALSSIEAVDLLRFADAFSDKLASATAELSRGRGHEREKGWMDAALAVIDEARKPAAGLVERARGLPELAELRAEFGVALLNAWVDALEKLLAGITFHVSGRAPIIEALFPHQKFLVLRKGPREAVEKYNKDFEKRLRSGYVGRMLATEDFTFAGPVLEHVAKAWTEYVESFSSEGLPPEAAAPIRRELIEAAERVELAIRQARLVAEAALLPVAGAFEASGLAMKPKKRARVAAATSAEGSIEGASEDSSEDSSEDEALAAEADEAAGVVEAEASEADADGALADASAPDASHDGRSVDGDGVEADRTANGESAEAHSSADASTNAVGAQAADAAQADASTPDTSHGVRSVNGDGAEASDAAQADASLPTLSVNGDGAAAASAHQSTAPVEPKKRPRKKKADEPAEPASPTES